MPPLLLLAAASSEEEGGELPLPPLPLPAPSPEAPGSPGTPEPPETPGTPGAPGATQRSPNTLSERARILQAAWKGIERLTGATTHPGEKRYTTGLRTVGHWAPAAGITRRPVLLAGEATEAALKIWSTKYHVAESYTKVVTASRLELEYGAKLRGRAGLLALEPKERTTSIEAPQ